MLFSGSYIAGKYTTVDLDPLTATLFRYVVALVFLLALMPLHWRDSMKLERQDLGIAVLLGLTGIVGYHYFFFLSLRHTAVANTSIINALSPVFTGVGAAVFLRERLTGLNYLGIAIAVTGVWALLTDVQPGRILELPFNRGDETMLAAVLCFVMYALLIKTLVDRYSSYVLTLYATFFGVIWLLLIAPVEQLPVSLQTMSASSTYAILYMGVAGSGLGYLTFNLSVKSLGATRSSGFVYSVIPIFVAGFAYVFFAEPVTLAMVVSTVLILAGLKLMLNRR
jgi:drug/metabolite transporter (DMT)-like permease